MTHTQTQNRIVTRRRLLGLGGVIVIAAFAVALWATLAPVSFWAVLTPQFNGDELTVQAAHQKAVDGEIVLIDIRRPDEWRKTGIGEGANPIDMRRDDFVTVLSTLVEGNKDAPIALICARGVRSAGLGKRLTEAGFTRIIDVPEGMLGSRAGPGWLASDLPTRTYKEPSE